MKSQFKKLLLGFVIGFIVLFLLRLTYLLIYVPYEPAQTPDISIVNSYSPDNDGSTFGKIRNIATNTIQQVENAAGPTGQIITTIVQKYEKIGSLGATSTHFDRDEKKLRAIIRKYQAMDQYEQNTGLKGDRELKIAIGVDPERFDRVVKDIKTIGKLTSFDVSTYDKTAEYRELQAKRTTLESSRSALEALKQKGGNIDENINLENRIMELDTEIQSLGVNIGDFDKSGSFCTIKFTLTEVKTKEKVPVMTQTMRAFEWTEGKYLLLVFIILAASAAALATIKIYEAVRNMQKRDDNTISGDQ